MAVTGSGLQVVDISAPSTPHIVGSVVTPNAVGLTLDGSYAYLADWVSGLQVVDVTELAPV
jgi:hypothetical protein